MLDSLVKAVQQAHERGDQTAEWALQLLAVVCGMALSSDARAPFGRYMGGTDGDKRPWHTPLPADLTDRHVAALEMLLGVITTPVLRGQVADVLWNRLPRRNPEHARAAIAAYLSVSEAMFDPVQWSSSEHYFSRAYQIASRLGPRSKEFGTVIATAWTFLARLDGNEPLYYTEKIVARILPTLSEQEATTLFDRVRTVAEQSSASHDFERARTYYELAVTLAQRLKREDDVTSLRRLGAETFVTQAEVSPTETERTLFLRLGREALLSIGAPRERVGEIAQMLEQSQALAVSEMTPISADVDLGDSPEEIQNELRGCDPIRGLWLLAGAPAMPRHDDVRRAAEESVGAFNFLYGFGRRHITQDGRTQGQTPGSVSGGVDGRESAIRGAMRDLSAEYRVRAVLGTIEPGRRQLLLEHQYTLREIVDAIRHRPFIPNGHVGLWVKGIHAGLVGEYDVAAHLLAPQLENALRQVLRRSGVIVYTTQNDFQRLFSVENVLDHEKAQGVFGKDYIFALDTLLADRLGANVRNDVAHGIAGDQSSNPTKPHSCGGSRCGFSERMDPILWLRHHPTRRPTPL